MNPAPTPLLTLHHYWMRQANLIRRAYKIAIAVFTEACGHLGITRPQFETMMAIASFPAQDQISLARAIGIDRSTTALILDGLAERGLVERTVDHADRRKRTLRLTQQGAIVIEQARLGAGLAQSRLLAALSSSESEALIAALRTVITHTPSRAPTWSVPQAPERGFGPVVAALANRPGFLLRRTVQVGYALFDEKTAGLDLTPTQFGLLFLLEVLPADHADTARLVGVERSTSDRLLARLKARGYVEKALDAGRPILRLTREGGEVFEAARRLADEADEIQLSCLAPDQRAGLLDSLAKLVFFHQG